MWFVTRLGNHEPVRANSQPPEGPEEPLRGGELMAERYRVEALLSIGGTAFVYRATDEQLGRPVALKVMKQALVGHAGRFSREARAMAALIHPAVVRVYEFGEVSGGRPYLAMEFVPGETLGARLSREEQLPAAEAARILAQVAGALCEAHAAGIRHRDVKPDNIMIQPVRGGRPVVRLLDFGIAGFDEQTGPGITRQGQIMGTPQYMAPEQAIGEVASNAADVWALGAVLYRMLAGVAAFDGSDTPEVLYKVVREEVAPLPEGVPQVLRDVVFECLSKKPDSRPTAENVLGRLESFVLGQDRRGAAPTNRASGAPPARREVFEPVRIRKVAPLPSAPTPMAFKTAEYQVPRQGLPRLGLGVFIGALVAGFVALLLMPEPAPQLPPPPSAPATMLIADQLLEADLGPAALAWVQSKAPKPMSPEWSLRSALAHLGAGKITTGLTALQKLLNERPDLASDARLAPAVVATMRFKRGKAATPLLTGPLAKAAQPLVRAQLEGGPNSRARHQAADVLGQLGEEAQQGHITAWRMDLRSQKSTCASRRTAFGKLVEFGHPPSPELRGRLLGEKAARRCLAEQLK